MIVAAWSALASTACAPDPPLAGRERRVTAPVDEQLDRSAARPPPVSTAAPADTAEAPLSGTTSTSPSAPAATDPLVDDLTRELTEAPATERARPLTVAEARCTPARTLGRLGADLGARLGSQPAAPGQPDVGILTPAERRAVADAVRACIDVARRLAEQLLASLEVPAARVACVVDTLGDEGTLGDVRRPALARAADPAEWISRLSGALTDALRRCLTPDELGRLGLGDDRDAGADRAGG